MSKRVIPAGWTTIRQCSEFVGISPQGLHQNYLTVLSEADVDRTQRQILVRVAAIIELMVARRASEANELIATGSDSPALERLREAKAKLSELDFAERSNAVVGRDKLRDILGRLASHLRHAGENLQRNHGAAASQILNCAMDEFQETMKREWAEIETYTVHVED